MILRLLFPLLIVLLAVGCTYTSTGRRIDTPPDMSQAGYPYVFIQLDGERGKAYVDETTKRVTVSVLDSSGKVASQYVEQLYGADLVPAPSWDNMELSIDFKDRASHDVLAQRKFSILNGKLNLIE